MKKAILSIAVIVLTAGSLVLANPAAPIKKNKCSTASCTMCGDCKCKDCKCSDGKCADCKDCKSCSSGKCAAPVTAGTITPKMACCGK